MWTKFFDMSSGGSTKVKVDGKWKDYIYIELPYERAIRYFENKFDRHPHNVTCECCGKDYSIDEYESLEDATKWNREEYTSKGKVFLTLDEFVNKDKVLIIYKEEIEES